MADTKNSGSDNQSFLTMAQAAERTGLTAGRIRYYDQEFGDFLKIPRGPGSRRLFNDEVVERLTTLKKLLKDEGLSIRQAKAFLGLTEGPAPVITPPGPPAPPSLETAGEPGADLAGELAELRDEVVRLGKNQEELRGVLTRLVAMVSGLLEQLDSGRSG